MLQNTRRNFLLASAAAALAGISRRTAGAETLTPRATSLTSGEPYARQAFEPQTSNVAWKLGMIIGVGNVNLHARTCPAIAASPGSLRDYSHRSGHGWPGSEHLRLLPGAAHLRLGAPQDPRGSHRAIEGGVRFCQARRYSRRPDSLRIHSRESQ